MTLPLDTLRRLANEATPGPWDGPIGTLSPAAVRRIDRDEQDRRRITFLFEALSTRSPDVDPDQARRNASYIAALDPQTALAVIDAAEAGERLVRAYDAHNDALNGQGHPGEPHDRALHHELPGDTQIYETVSDCAGCGAAQYGTEDEVQQAVVAIKLALGYPLRPYEDAAALAATRAEETRLLRCSKCGELYDPATNDPMDPHTPEEEA